MALVVTAVVVSTAYLAAGALHDRMMPEEEGPAATVTILAIATDGLGGVQEHVHVPATWVSGQVYDVGVRVVGLRSESGMVIKFSLARPNISPEDVSVFYYDAASDSWKPLTMSDEGDVLEGTLGLAGGIAVYEGYDQLHRLLIYSHIDGSCQVEAWAEHD
jgi:hypothetical protein